LKNTFAYIEIILFAFILLFRAWRIKKSNNLSTIRFSGSFKCANLSTDMYEFGVACANNLTRYGTLNSGRKCFFKAYILGGIFNRLSLPVIINIGLKINSRMKSCIGHCWLSINDEMIEEGDDFAKVYLYKLCDGDVGIKYWYVPEKSYGDNVK